MKIDITAHQDIIEAYEIDLWSLQEIADILHVSKTAVKKFLNQQGIDTSKRLIPVSCTACGAEIMRNRKRIRHQKNHFCNADCYASYLQAGRAEACNNRSQQRKAQAVVSKYFKLSNGSVVHHIDRNQFNNHPSNLLVFANNGDHIRYHHIERDAAANTSVSSRRAVFNRQHRDSVGLIVPILWDGRIITSY